MRCRGPLFGYVLAMSFVGDNRSYCVSETRYPIIPILAVWGVCTLHCPTLYAACRRYATSHLAGSIARRCRLHSLLGKLDALRQKSFYDDALSAS